MLQFCDVKIDMQARLVTDADEIVHLTPTEFRLLNVLVNRAGRVVINPQLLRKVWGDHMETTVGYCLILPN